MDGFEKTKNRWGRQTHTNIKVTSQASKAPKNRRTHRKKDRHTDTQTGTGG
jgi:hypothetical protein